MFPVSLKSSLRVRSDLHRWPEPTREDFDLFLRLLERRKDAEATALLARQPRLATFGVHTYSNRVLAYALQSGCGRSVIQALLEAGAPVNGCVDSERETPLMRAAHYGDLDALQTLMQAGAEIEARSNWGQTPLIAAARGGAADVIEALIYAGANVEAVTNVGNTPLMFAAEGGHCDAIKVLLREGANLEARDRNGRTPLMYAAQKGHVDAIKTLANSGVIFDAKDNDGRTALSVAAIGRYAAATELLQLGYAMRGLSPGPAELEMMKKQGIPVLTPEQISVSLQRLDAERRSMHAVRHQLSGSYPEKLRRYTTTPNASNVQKQRDISAAGSGSELIWTQQQLADTRAELASAKDKVRLLDTECANLRSQLEQCALKDQRLEQQLDTLMTRRTASLEQRLETILQVHHNNTQNVAAQWRVEKASLEQRLQELHNLRAEQQQRLSEGQTRLQAMQDKLANTETQLRKTQCELDSVQAELARLSRSEQDYRALLDRQAKLEQDKACLEREKQDWRQRHENLRVRLLLLEAEQHELLARVPQADALPAQQADLTRQRAHLDARQISLQNQQDSPARQQQLQALASEERDWRAQAELMEAQLRIFEQYGVSPIERALNTFLKELKRSPLLNQRLPQIFISYAWEDTTTPAGRTANERLQGQLLRLERYLEKLGATVWLDVTSLHGNMNHYMETKLAASRYVLLIGTPRLKARIEQRPDSAVAFEFSRIQARNAADPTCLIPVLLEGDRDNAFPPGVQQHFVHDLCEEGAWPRKLAQLAGPNENCGLIPTLYGLTASSDKHTGAYKSYASAWNHLRHQLDALADYS